MICRYLLWVAVAGCVLLLVGCTASWQAPLDSRDRAARPAPPRTTQATPRNGSKPAPSVRRAVRPQGSPTYHRVRRGETLYAIAWRYAKNFSDLARWNGIRPPHTIYPGQMLRLKPRQNAKAAATTKVKPNRKPRPAKPIAANPPQQTPKKKPGTGSKKLQLIWKWPVQGRILSKYSSRDATRNGLKLGGSVGQPVRAAEGGKVVYSGSGLIGYGRLIIIKHNDRFLSAYGHNNRLLVKEGQQVKRGQQIADMGSSNTGVAMLHFEIRKNGQPIDPLSVLPNRRR